MINNMRRMGRVGGMKKVRMRGMRGMRGMRRRARTRMMRMMRRMMKNHRGWVRTGRHDDADEAPIVVLNDRGGGRGPPFVLDLGADGAPVVAVGVVTGSRGGGSLMARRAECSSEEEGGGDAVSRRTKGAMPLRR